MVESAAAGLDNSILIDNLSFKLRNGAAYVQERKSVSFYASGSNEYTTTGTKLVKLVCTSDSWLDPSTFRISFDVNNKAFDTYTGSGATTAVVPLEAKLLRPLSGPWSFFSSYENPLRWNDCRRHFGFCKNSRNVFCIDEQR